MHTTIGKDVIFIHDSDLSGNVIIKSLDSNQEMKVSFDDLKILFMKWLVNKRINKIESAESLEELLNI